MEDEIFTIDGYNQLNDDEKRVIDAVFAGGCGFAVFEWVLHCASKDDLQEAFELIKQELGQD